MIAVHRYPLPSPSEKPVALNLPSGAEVLSFHMKDGVANVWVRVDADAPVFEKRRFMLVGTGWDLGEAARWRFVGTVLVEKTMLGTLVWHLFEEPWR